MKIIETAIADVKIYEPRIFKDDRGYFFESFSAEKMNLGERFVQDNESKSSKGVLRGLHFQNPPYAQGKLVRVVQGSVLDVAVDIRKSSPTYGQYVKQVLSDQNKLTMWVPPGFAHGFLTLEDDTIFQYKCTNVYNKESEGAIKYNDPIIGIEWPDLELIISEKDQIAQSFSAFESLF